MGFRLSYITWITHLYLYYTLLVPHTYTSYIKVLMYIFLLWNTIQSSSISNIVSDLFLSSIVFIGVTSFSTSLLPSQQSLQLLAVEPPTSSSHCLRVPDLQPLSLRSPTPQTIARVVTAVYIALIAFLEVSLRSSSADESLAVTGDATHPHASPKDSASAPHELSSALADVTRDVISAMSALATSASNHLLTSVPRHSLTVDFSPGLTFSVQVLLTQFFT